MGYVLIPKPGGDKIGRRRLDTHFIGIQKLGADFAYDADQKIYKAKAEKLTGCYMLLDEASVTGTANIIMTAVMAEGITTIYNAACKTLHTAVMQNAQQNGSQDKWNSLNLLTIEG